MGAARLDDLAKALGLDLEGDGSLTITGVAPLDGAGPSELSFIRSERYAEVLSASAAGAVVAPPGLDVGARPVIRAGDPSAAFYRAAGILVPEASVVAGVHAGAHVAPTAEIDVSAAVAVGCIVGDGVRVGPRSVLHPGVVLSDGVQIGAECVLHARCVVTAASILGDRVILQPGVVIGGAGFGYTGDDAGGRRKVHDVGRVVLEDDVEIGANTTVDRGTLGDTRIGRGTKIDNLVQIAHNVQIGENVLIAAQTGISGSAVIEHDCVLLGQVGIVGHVRVGAHTTIGAQGSAIANVPEGQHLMGTPPMPIQDWRRWGASRKRLYELLKRVRRLERRLDGEAPGESS